MKKIFAELNAFRPELLCVLVSVAAGVGATRGFPPICRISSTGESRIRI